MTVQDTDLRRLAEQAIREHGASIDRKDGDAILALLDELRDEAAARQQALDVIVEQADRVAALEEGLRRVVGWWDAPTKTRYDSDLGPIVSKARALLAERSIGPDQLADLRQLVNKPGPVCDTRWSAGPANAMCLRCGNRFDEHTQAQPESEAGDD